MEARGPANILWVVPSDRGGNRDTEQGAHGHPESDWGWDSPSSGTRGVWTGIAGQAEAGETCSEA